jgi:hypothetical protein
MRTIQDAKEYTDECRDFCDGHADAYMRAIRIAEAADALFDLTVTAPQPGQPSKTDRLNALYREVREARKEGLLPGKVKQMRVED